MGKNADGSSVAAPIWNAFMKKILADKPIESFLAPQIPVRGIPVLDGTLASKTVVIDKASGKIATEYTPKSYRQEKTFAQYHSILHFIDKDHPLNGLIEPPSKDPHYAAWEAGIDVWIKKQEETTGIIIERADPPTETDDVHVPKNFPTVSIESPANNTTQEDRSLSIAVNAFAARGISRVEYYLDGFYLGNSLKAPYALSTTIPNTIDQGSHTIKAVAYDDVDNSGSASVQITLDVPSVRGGLDFIDPKNGQTIERQQDTYTVVVSLEYPTEFVSVSVYAREAETGLSQVIGTSMNPSSPFLTFPWALPEQGDWILSAHAEKEGDGDLDTAGIIVTVIPTTTTQEQPPAEETPSQPETEILVP